MTNITIALGALLIALGIGAYIGTDRESVTALLPAILGLPILLLGLAATREDWRRHAIHAALALALLGFLGTIPQMISVPDVVAGNDVERPTAVVVSTITGIACLIYVGLGVRSFIEARRAREAEAS